MKTLTTTIFTSFLLLAFSCSKESSLTLSSAVIDVSSKPALSSESSELTGAQALRIGKQVWKVRNLATSHYRNGDRIPQVKHGAQWNALTTGAWCWYNNDSATYAAYGKLYNWYAVNDPRGLAPEGWHVPSYEEWYTLSTYLGGNSAAGGKMKSTGTIEDSTGLWHAPNDGATNSSGYTGFPGGFRETAGNFTQVGFEGDWWSSTDTIGVGWCLKLFNDSHFWSLNLSSKARGYSVRCVKD